MLEQIVNRFPGVSCAYADATGKVATECYGVSDKEKNIIVDDRTIFPALSVSKFVTAICLMKLHEENKINIDAPVNRYLHKWKLRTVEGSESDATIRMLMCHTAGIADGKDAFYGLRRQDAQVRLLDILDGKTSYNDRPARVEKTPGTAFEYSDAGYCVLQLLMQEITGKSFETAVRENIFDPLHLKNTFFASPENLAYYEKHHEMATGYGEDGLPIAGRFPSCPDLAASGLWSTPQELLQIAKAFVAAFHGKSDFLQKKTAREMAAPVEKFQWTGLGVFIAGEDMLMTQGWGENGQCMVKMNCRTGAISAVMTNQNPDMDQSESGVEWLVNRNLV